MLRASLCAAVVAAALLVSTAAAAPLGEWTSGTAVPFGGPTDGQDPHQPSGGLKAGSCGYGELSQQAWPYWSAIAVGPGHPLAANASRSPLGGCGACVELQCDPRPGFEGRCPDGAAATSLVALVTDTCTSCAPDRVTLHYLSFQQKLSSPEGGEVGIRWRQVECAAPSPGIVADIDTYRATEGGYLRLSLEQVAGTGAIAAVELRRSPLAGDRLSLAGTTWSRMLNSWGAKWELSGLPEGPLDLRVTSDRGEALVAREAIKQAGVVGSITLPIQFSVAEQAGTADGRTTAEVVPAAASSCNATLADLLRDRPQLSTLLGHLESTGLLTLLQDPTATVTLFAPTNDAWAKVARAADLTDREVLQQVLAFHIVQGQVVIPSTQQMLPEDLASGGVLLNIDTLNGAPLQVFAGPAGIALRDGSALTPDAIVVSANNFACSSVLNEVEAVPLPYS
ncbi:barwin-like endoglucanase [Micractinium conductrix]|uniref:Barwin-like endoglucanase n=1 Tax=Micractinium conductrix TaxID=554055 RepID=A0A2P6VGG8_9CHLO|nr:barwin-like endoglucanase [Micractinium conductrix]|eukprot:PSC73189.1 barwin-like endoglucanase [Micractinium conductrix]